MAWTMVAKAVVDVFPQVVEGPAARPALPLLAWRNSGAKALWPGGSGASAAAGLAWVSVNGVSEGGNLPEGALGGAWSRWRTLGQHLGIRLSRFLRIVRARAPAKALSSSRELV